MKNKRITILALGAVALLLLPAIAMQFTTEVNWTSSDFIFAAIFLTIAATAFEVTMRLSKNHSQQITFGAMVTFGFVLLWAFLATA